MRVLVIHAHPSPDSFVSHLRNVVLDELASGGHEVRHHDLWQEQFDPVFTADEKKRISVTSPRSSNGIRRWRVTSKICAGAKCSSSRIPRGGVASPQC